MAYPYVKILVEFKRLVNAGMGKEMEFSAEELLFFDAKQDDWPLYLCLRDRILQTEPDTTIEVKKTQISLKNPRLFAAVSFLPVRKAALRPDPYITVTFGLFRPLTSPRVDALSEVYPNRWTHHVTVGDACEIDEELLGWIAEAAACARSKQGAKKTKEDQP